MKNYDGWAIKGNDGYISKKSFHKKRTDVVKWWNTAPWHTNIWKNYSRRNGCKIVKVKLVEVVEPEGQIDKAFKQLATIQKSIKKHFGGKMGSGDA